MESYDDFPLIAPHPEDRPAWHKKVYAGSDGTMGKRRRPNKQIVHEVLTRQRNRCLYCDNTFGTFIHRHGKAIVVKLVWDHEAPFVYLQRSPNDNWVAACSSCNSIKYSMMFATLVEAQEFIRQKRREKGYDPA